MRRIGVSLDIEVLLNEPESEAAEVTLREFGSARNMLAVLRSAGVDSIEIHNARAFHETVRQRTLRAIAIIHEAGFETTVHIGLTDIAGREYVSCMKDVLREALDGQKRSVFTVHPAESAERTRELYADWLEAFASFDGRAVLALENMRDKKPGTQYVRLSGAYETVSRVNGFITWDMGHYAGALYKAGLPLETIPSQNCLKHVAHTHIHSLYTREFNTHFPLKTEDEPVTDYIKALRDIGYEGIYNLELEPYRWLTHFSPREGMESSVAVLKKLLSE